MDLAESLRVRHATARDLRKCAALTEERDSFLGRWSAVDLGQWLEVKGCYVLLAEYEGVLLGLTIYSVDADGVVEIEGLYVSPLFRRMGIGSSLLKHALAHLKPGQPAVFIVSERADALLFFLRHHGFKAVGVVGDHYQLVYDPLGIRA